MVNKIFNKYNCIYNKLEIYGFILDNNKYYYSKYILDNTFRIDVYIDLDNNISVNVIDIEFDSIYTNYLNNNGSFASNIKDILYNTLIDIRDNCFISKYFIYDQSNRVCDYIYNKYKDKPLFLWDSSPDHGVFKNSNTNKWYGIIMHINKNKFNLDDSDCEVINIKLDKDKILDLLKLDGFYLAYHMNKKYWISIILDDTVSDEIIFKLIDESYSYSTN